MVGQRRDIELVSFYLSTQDRLMPRLAKRLGRLFGLDTEVHAIGFDPEVSFDPHRGQYSSRGLLAELLQDRPHAYRILGVTSVDLYMPVLSFVFGEAQLKGRAAIVSIHRLRGEVYGLRPNRRALESRLAKEAIHELGHTFGLLHCLENRCVMSRSTYVEDIDIKSDRFCGDCSAALRAFE